MAVIYGVNNDGSPITIEGYATFLLETAKASHKFELDTVKDEANFDASLIASNGHRELDITWTPSGATKADAAATAVFLEPLTKVTLEHFKVDSFNGDYIYVGDAMVELNHKQGKMSMKLRKYDDDDQNTSLTTTVS
jgi:hypothetical protein